MADPFVAEIRIFPFNFAPRGWAFCNGQLMPLSQNTALFSLVGTFYGGDGKSTFGLPNLQGSAPVAQGQGPGLSQRFIGESGGSPTITLLSSEMAIHPHRMMASTDPADNSVPTNEMVAKPLGRGNNLFTAATTPLVPMNQNALGVVGGSQPHNNMMPCLTLNFCIALQGIFPPRG